MASPEALQELEKMRAKARLPDTRSLPVRRREWEAEAQLDILPKGAHFSAVVAGGVPAEWMEMPRHNPGRVCLWLHGGGYNAGSPKINRKLSANLARVMNMRLLLPDYRLAPEHPFPAGVKDALLAFGWLLAQGRAAEDIVVGGESAGGGLALSMLLALREAGAPMPRAAILLAPWTDLTVSSPSYETLRGQDPIITREGLRDAGLWYAGRRDPADPMLSPLFADLSGLPPMLIHAGGDEVMVDDSRLLAQRAAAAGVEATLKIWPGMWHTFHGATHVPEALQAIGEIGEYVRARFNGAGQI